MQPFHICKCCLRSAFSNMKQKAMTFHEFYSHSDERLQRKYCETELPYFNKCLLPHDKFTEFSKHTRQMISKFRSNFFFAPCILIYIEFTHQQKNLFFKNTLKFTLKYA